jgi:hypothetical protein
MTSLAHSPTNDTRMNDLIKEVRALGADKAAGGDALPAFAFRLAYAAADGVISTQEDPNGDDDAKRLYAEFTKTWSKKAIHEHTDGGTKANVSKARQIIKAAAKPTCDFPNTLQKVKTKREELDAADVKVKAAYAAYVDAARKQCTQDDDLSDAQIEEVCRKKESEDPTVEKILEGIAKKLEKLVTGEGGPKDDAADTMEAYQAVRRRIAALLHKADMAEKLAGAVELGLITEAEAEAQLAAA